MYKMRLLTALSRQLRLTLYIKILLIMDGRHAVFTEMLLRAGLLFSLCFVKITVQTCHSLYRDHQKCDSIQDLLTTPNLTKAFVDKAYLMSSLQFIPDTIEELTIQFHSIDYIGREAFKSSQRLRVLKIDTNDIETIHRETFKNLPNLEVLALVHNERLESIQGSISDLPKLLTLNLAGNNLRDITLRNLSSLENLHLNNNTFSKFEGAFLPKLSVLHLHHNRLKVFDASQLHSLTRLYMAHNLLTEVDVNMFKNLNRLHYLDLRNNNILNIEHGAFEHTPELRVLILSQNSLTVLDGEVFPVRGLKKLGSLFLDGNKLEFMSMRLLGRLQQLKTISIRGNPWKCSCLDVVLMWCLDYDVNVECREMFFDGMRPVCVVSSRNGMSHCTFTYDARSYTFFAYRSSLYPGGYNLTC